MWTLLEKNEYSFLTLLSRGATTRQFVGHTKDVLSVAFSADNRQIVSGARDKTIKLWNTLGVCKYTIQEDGHTEWVSCVRFSPNTSNPIIVSCGWDKLVKVRTTQLLRLVSLVQPQPFGVYMNLRWIKLKSLFTGLESDELQAED